MNRLHGEIRHVGSVWFAPHMTFQLLQVSAGDLVFHGEECGQVLTCCAVDGDDTLMLIVDVLRLVAPVSPHSAKYTRVEGDAHRAVWKACLVEGCCAWYDCGGGITAVVRI